MEQLPKQIVHWVIKETSKSQRTNFIHFVSSNICNKTIKKYKLKTKNSFKTPLCLEIN